MEFKILCLNIRGMNDFDKQISVKNLVASQKSAFCLLQETKIQYINDNFVRQLWYDDNFGWAYIPSTGSSGRLLSIWYSARFEKIDERIGLNNITVVFFTRINGFRWALTNVYSPCEYAARTDFWLDMNGITSWWNDPLCIAGDMNAMRSNAERNRGDGDSRNNALLNNYILDNELIDQPLLGGSYTWSNNHDDPILCRLDRFLFIHAFEETFPNALQVVLTRTISDHNPILLISESVMPSKSYFKLDRMWVEHKEFVEKVQQWWDVMNFNGSASTQFFLKLQNLKHLIKPWRLSEFGSVAREKVVLTGRIHDLNILEEDGALSRQQLEEMTQFKLKLKGIETLEARKWQLRAKQNEFKWGDSNTRYFALPLQEGNVILFPNFKLVGMIVLIKTLSGKNFEVFILIFLLNKTRLIRTWRILIFQRLKR
ncbi:uncharacterized protein LOC113313045 [Papaver somniferum]|uniref:uncharacterized protein LOC113313045 n=1 Tax=Papaver somniferum TaxID=3469 RepID=UPI000E703F65|nr:uncharacterized protein LOC113313045 [Papaver somniferum]